MFDVDPIMALDGYANTIFPLKTSFSHAQLFQILGAPVVKPQQSLSISAEQTKVLQDRGIPAPIAIHTKDIEIRTIQPILTLGIAKNFQNHKCPGAYSMWLSISYNGMEAVPAIPQNSIISQFNEGILERCTRDLKREQDLLEGLIAKYNLKALSSYFFGSVPVPGYYGFENTPDWYDFLESGVAQLEHGGWQVLVEDDFDLRFNDVDQWYADIDQDSNNGWFDLDLGIEVGGKKIELLPILLASFKGQRFTDALQGLLENPDEKKPVHLSENQYVLLPNQRLIPLLETFVELFDRETSLEDGKMRLSSVQRTRLIPLSDPSWQWHGGKQLRNQLAKLREFKGVDKVPVPKQFTGKLRDYQQQGVDWLQFARRFQLGVILSDDMGLGKTVQALAHLCVEKKAGRLQNPCLIVAPTSLMSNWRQEVSRFAPGLSLLLLHGQQRQSLFDQIDSHDIVLTSYALAVRDVEIYQQHSFYYLILDESQKIKNPKSKSAQVLRDIGAAHRLCLTGTPMENHLGELWSQFNFLMPGFLGDERNFNQHYRKPIEKQDDLQRRTALQQRIAPVLLRRTKELVATELPAKTEIINSVELIGAQRDLYETIRLMMHKKVRQEISNKGIARSHIMILDALLKLRQVCCHPGLLKLKAAEKVSTSAKLELLMGMLPELVAEGRRILLFSQFTSMLSVIEAELEKAGIGFVKLTGRTRDRDIPIQSFQNGEAPLFLISLKAGGTGLNLIRADTVIHYDPWWNPAVEDQATDRAHRIGQDKPVFVYKLVTENTVESKILEMQARKRELAKQTLGKAKPGGAAMTEEDLKHLFAPLVRE